MKSLLKIVAIALAMAAMTQTVQAALDGTISNPPPQGAGDPPGPG